MNSTQTSKVVSHIGSAQHLVSASHAWANDQAFLGKDPESLRRAILQHFSRTLGRDIDYAAAHYLFKAVALSIRDRMMEQWLLTRQVVIGSVPRHTCYLSMEYLMGRALRNAVHNLHLEESLAQALEQMGLSLETTEELEADAGLGNGGLGRLAACFLDSCASLGLPVTGYGLRYRYGMFRQSIDNGFQVEHPDNWLNEGHMWELERPELACHVHFGGRVDLITALNGEVIHRWIDTDDVRAVPFDVPVPGRGNGVINTLRLWSSAATHEFNLNEFNAGGYTEAVAARTSAENITMVLYPNDASENGKVLRLRQQYFLVSASLQDTIRIWKIRNEGFEGFADAHCFQLNDTHPSLAVPELMRLLIDVHGVSWDKAWSITTQVMAYTNHTLLPEALECWSLDMIGALLPRPVEIIHEINRRFLEQVALAMPDNLQRQAEMSIISFDAQPVVRMAHLAIVGSFSINGVAALHSRLLQEGLFANFAALWPERFNNKTNGVTHRRWLAYCNPGMCELLDETLGSDWIENLDRIERLAPLASNASFQQRWRQIRQQNKRSLAALVAERTGVKVNTEALFDVQVKRMHEYKRQLLCALHAAHVYLELLEGREHAPRFVLIAGKAAPGYYMAKSIIKLIGNVADVINNDARIGNRLKLVFLPDYNVSAMECICPAADLSEQVSTAGKEASGTGNMKFMMNGAITIGTHDGANVEILDAVGEENFFSFGLNVEQVEATRRDYSPASLIAADARLRRLFGAFDSGLFSGGEADLIRGVIDAAKNPGDPWLTVADLPDYLDAQRRVEVAWKDPERWTRMSILNTAHSARFSTDRTMRDYNRDIWRLQPIEVCDSNRQV